MDDRRRLILDQALALVDERGLAAMSMRAVAERVGLTSMALYPYVGGKDALLDGLVDLLHLELGTTYDPSTSGPSTAGQSTSSQSTAGPSTAGAGPDAAGIDWRHRLRALGRAVRALAFAHPGAFPLLLTRPAAGAPTSWLTAALRATLHDAGVPAARVPRLARMICAFLLGWTTGEVTGGLPGQAVEDAEPPPFGTAPSDTALGAGAAPPVDAAAAAADFDAALADLVSLIESALLVA